MEHSIEVKNFYDDSIDFWVNSWGEHLHQGYYEPGKSNITYQQSQINLLETILQWANVKNVSDVLDAGCGIGGSSRFLANKFGAHVTGITNSLAQINLGSLYAQLIQPIGEVKYLVADLENIQFEESIYDLIFCIETIEHIHDKKGLLNTFYKALKPGGCLLIGSLFQSKVDDSLLKNEHLIKQKIEKSFLFSSLKSIEEIKSLALKTGFSQILSKNVTSTMVPFWKSGFKNYPKKSMLKNILKFRFSMFKGIFNLRHLNQGYKSNLIQYHFFKAQKPVELT